MFRAELTMFWQRKDWQKKLKKAEPKAPMEPLDPLPAQRVEPPYLRALFEPIRFGN
jgi:hypothetical protein